MLVSNIFLAQTICSRKEGNHMNMSSKYLKAALLPIGEDDEKFNALEAAAKDVLRTSDGRALT